jgi:hypothetical protein
MYKILRTIHLSAGLMGSLIVFLMAVTGILLNHRSLIGYTSDTAFKIQEFVFALHSGNVRNINLVWLTDLGAICMMVLSISGVWMWMKLIGKKRRSKNNV